jgi:hypothetical protein
MGDKTKPDGIEQLVAAARAGASESVWLDVIQKMDEVATSAAEVALETRTRRLRNRSSSSSRC